MILVMIAMLDNEDDDMIVVLVICHATLMLFDDINEDIANVYIDLCGLRKEAAAQNPQAPYEIGTPQWKFLCSPLASPYSFLEITEYDYIQFKSFVNILLLLYNIINNIIKVNTIK